MSSILSGLFQSSQGPQWRKLMRYVDHPETDKQAHPSHLAPIPPVGGALSGAAVLTLDSEGCFFPDCPYRHPELQDT